MRIRSWLRFGTMTGAFLALALAWSTAGAEAPKKKVPPPVAAEDAPPRRDANNQTGLSEAMATVIEGNQKFAQKDVEGALAAYQKAVKLQPRNALAQYVLAEALMTQNKLQEAEVALAAADDSASQSSPYKARILFVYASLRERQHKFAEAKELWRRYLELVPTRPDGGVYPNSATERLKMVDDWIKLDAAYEVVRQRVVSDAGLPPPPPADAAPPKK